MENGVLIVRPEQLAEFCDRLSRSRRIAFDTEFVPEYTYAPQLCLIQVAGDDNALGVIDPLAVPNLRPFWELLLSPEREVIAHAAKEEVAFCVRETGKTPAWLFDVQLAAGLVGLGYPLSHENLTNRVLNVRVNAAETRTDWRKRPLSEKQIEYALDDVRHLLAARDRLVGKLQSLRREAWMAEEMGRFLEQFSVGRDEERWRRVAGAGGLPPRDLAVLRELAEWRDRRARQLDKPPKWVLRDDLLVQLAKRRPGNLADLQSTRGIGNVTTAGWARELLESIRRGVDAPEDSLPKRVARRETADEQMILKLLSAAMIHLADQSDVATSLLGSNDDLRDLMDWQLSGERSEHVPRLARGWRAEVCGNHLTDLLQGRMIVRVRRDGGAPRLVFEADRRASEG